MHRTRRAVITIVIVAIAITVLLVGATATLAYEGDRYYYRYRYGPNHQWLPNGLGRTFILAPWDCWIAPRTGAGGGLIQEILIKDRFGRTVAHLVRQPNGGMPLFCPDYPNPTNPIEDYSFYW